MNKYCNIEEPQYDYPASQPPRKGNYPRPTRALDARVKRNEDFRDRRHNREECKVIVSAGFESRLLGN
eukprot:6259355-Amphidinium_carterae.1